MINRRSHYSDSIHIIKHRLFRFPFDQVCLPNVEVDRLFVGSEGAMFCPNLLGIFNNHHSNASNPGHMAESWY
jgi:hypothetical protein